MEDALGDMDLNCWNKNGKHTSNGYKKLRNRFKKQWNKPLNSKKWKIIIILNENVKVIDKPRENISPLAPRVIVMDNEPDKIKDVIDLRKFIKKIL